MTLPITREALNHLKISSKSTPAARPVRTARGLSETARHPKAARRCGWPKRKRGKHVPSPLQSLLNVPRTRATCLAAALTLASACDALKTTAPPLTPAPGLPRHDETGDAVLGSTSLAWNTGLTPFGTAPENRWVLVRASGEWTAVDNPACGGQPPDWPCSKNPPFGDFDPEYPDAFRGPVLIETRHGESRTGFPMRGIGGGNGVGLTKADYTRELYTASGAENPFVQEFGNTGPSVYSYILDGSYTVTATAIQSPIRVTEGSQEADGTRTYTVEPLYGLQFINPQGLELSARRNRLVLLPW